MKASINKIMSDLNYKQVYFYTDICDNHIITYQNKNKVIVFKRGVIIDSYLIINNKIRSQKQLDELQIDNNNLRRDVDYLCDLSMQLCVEKLDENKNKQNN